MKFTVYCTTQHINKISATETRFGIPHESIHHKLEASDIFDAMAKFSKDEKGLIKSNKKLGWKITYTNNGYIMESNSYVSIISNFRIVAEGE